MGNDKATAQGNALRRIERQIWDDRQKAFEAYYATKVKRDPYADGLQWGILATFDHALSTFREVLQGAGGSGGAQMDVQKRRIGVE